MRRETLFPGVSSGWDGTSEKKGLKRGTGGLRGNEDSEDGKGWIKGQKVSCGC